MARNEIIVEASIKAPPEAVFKVLTDHARVHEWMPHVTEAKVVGSKRGVGAERTIRMRLHQMEIHSRQRVTHHEPGKRFAWVHTQDTLDGKPFEFLEDVGSQFHLTAHGKTTHVRALMHFSPKGLKATLAVPLVVRDVKKQMETALENLKRLCEPA